MVSRIRRVIARSLFAVYGGVALLGHAGLHALQGKDHLHVHGNAVAAHTHVHSSCCHHHGPHTADQSDLQPSQHHGHHHHGPEHDHDDCVICQHFAAKACLLTQDAALNLTAGVAQFTPAAATFTPGDDRYVLPIRGPPAAAC